MIEAGDLRRNAPLRVVCERAKNAAALPCYADTERDLARLIDSEMRAGRADAHARRARAAHSAPWRRPRSPRATNCASSRSTRAGAARSSIDDVTAVVSDASALALDELIDAAFAGRPAELEAQLAKARAAGSARRLDLFRRAAPARAAAQMAHGDRSAAGVSRSIRCSRRCTSGARIWSRRRSAVERGAACRRYGRPRRRGACLPAMPALADTIAERALLSIATKARRAAA